MGGPRQFYFLSHCWSSRASPVRCCLFVGKCGLRVWGRAEEDRVPSLKVVSTRVRASENNPTIQLLGTLARTC